MNAGVTLPTAAGQLGGCKPGAGDIPLNAMGAYSPSVTLRVLWMHYRDEPTGIFDKGLIGNHYAECGEHEAHSIRRESMGIGRGPVHILSAAYRRTSKFRWANRVIHGFVLHKRCGAGEWESCGRVSFVVSWIS